MTALPAIIFEAVRKLLKPSPGKAVREGITAVGAKTPNIEPGSPWENGSCESFSSKLRDELLKGGTFYSLQGAQVIIGNWRQHYNRVRPHSSLGYGPPVPNETGDSLKKLLQRFLIERHCYSV